MRFALNALRARDGATTRDRNHRVPTLPHTENGGSELGHVMGATQISPRSALPMDFRMSSPSSPEQEGLMRPMAAAPAIGVFDRSINLHSVLAISRLPHIGAEPSTIFTNWSQRLTATLETSCCSTYLMAALICQAIRLTTTQKSRVRRQRASSLPDTSPHPMTRSQH